jgi:hypothetical protein
VVNPWIKWRCGKLNSAARHPGREKQQTYRPGIDGRIDIGQTVDAKYMMNETARHRGNRFVGCANARTAH